MAKVLNEEASPDEHALLNRFLQENTEAAQQFDMLGKIWSMDIDAQPVQNAQLVSKNDERLNRIMARAMQEREQGEPVISIEDEEPVKVRRMFPFYLKYAAAILVIVVSSLYFFNNSLEKEPKTLAQIEVSAENGSRKRVMLPDGTSVLLNSGSKLQYNSEFGENTRDVTLFGEAFFDVVKQTEHPFIVHTEDINIKVLGTAFNVKSYPDDDVVETTLIRGLVEIKREEQPTAEAIYLHPNEKVTMPRCANCGDQAKKETVVNEPETKPGTVVQLDSIAKDKEWVETAWIYNRLEFRKSSFADIAKKLERWYGVDITIGDEQLARQTFNGSFENETLEQALNALQKTISFTYKINNNEVLIEASE